MPVDYWVTAGVTAMAVVICVSLHYEALRLISRMPLPAHNHRARIVLLILGLLAAHIVEIWVFGAGYYVLLSFGDHGTLTGNGAMSLLDCVYYSATVFTTLGFGDIVPSGALRFMTGTEAIAGLTIITWSASYTFLVMNRTWRFGE
ncbi:MAG: potassium channel family protein [Woeseiaceae bacterium]|nr:potassium channel family protein [Woeseiaceae bacterium]